MSEWSIFSIFSIIVLQEFCIYFAGTFRNYRKNRKIASFFSLLLIFDIDCTVKFDKRHGYPSKLLINEKVSQLRAFFLVQIKADL